MQKIKTDDEVVVIAGRSKGQQGRVLKVLENDRLLVEGVNMVTKHQKPNPQKGEQGGRVSQEAPIHVSNVMLWNDDAGKGCRVGIQDVDGKKVRVFKLEGGETQVVD